MTDFTLRKEATVPISCLSRGKRGEGGRFERGSFDSFRIKNRPPDELKLVSDESFNTVFEVSTYHLCLPVDGFPLFPFWRRAVRLPGRQSITVHYAEEKKNEKKGDEILIRELSPGKWTALDLRTRRNISSNIPLVDRRRFVALRLTWQLTLTNMISLSSISNSPDDPETLLNCGKVESILYCVILIKPKVALRNEDKKHRLNLFAVR